MRTLRTFGGRQMRKKNGIESEPGPLIYRNLFSTGTAVGRKTFFLFTSEFFLLVAIECAIVLHDTKILFEALFEVVAGIQESLIGENISFSTEPLSRHKTVACAGPCHQG
jgi:hypothetical protein